MVVNYCVCSSDVYIMYSISILFCITIIQNSTHLFVSLSSAYPQRMCVHRDETKIKYSEGEIKKYVHSKLG